MHLVTNPPDPPKKQELRAAAEPHKRKATKHQRSVMWQKKKVEKNHLRWSINRRNYQSSSKSSRLISSCRFSSLQQVLHHNQCQTAPAKQQREPRTISLSSARPCPICRVTSALCKRSHTVLMHAARKTRTTGRQSLSIRPSLGGHQVCLNQTLLYPLIPQKQILYRWERNIMKFVLLNFQIPEI